MGLWLGASGEVNTAWVKAWYCICLLITLKSAIILSALSCYLASYNNYVSFIHLLFLTFAPWLVYSWGMRSGTTGVKHLNHGRYLMSTRATKVMNSSRRATQSSKLGRKVARGSVATDAVVSLSGKCNPCARSFTAYSGGPDLAWWLDFWWISQLSPTIRNVGRSTQEEGVIVATTIH